MRQHWRMGSESLEWQQEGKDVVVHPLKTPQTIHSEVIYITIKTPTST